MGDGSEQEVEVPTYYNLDRDNSSIELDFGEDVNPLVADLAAKW